MTDNLLQFFGVESYIAWTRQTIDVISLYMLYVRGNNCDTDDVEYYVNHLMVAVLRELDGDTLLYYRSKPHHDGSVMTGCRRRDCLRKI